VTDYATRLRRVAWDLRTEGAGPVREAVAIGLGVFVGCSPLYGLHLVLCWALGWCLGLNRLKMYLAANISNPFVAPLLILSELQVGALLRRGQFHPLTLETVRTVDPWGFGVDLVVGSVVVGGGLGVMTGLLTYLTLRAGAADACFGPLARRAADRYVAGSIAAWEFARGKLRGDPLYRTVLMDCQLPSGGTLVDVGCGQGLMLALLAEAASMSREGAWPGACPAVPVFDRLVGIETRRRVASVAVRALGDRASIVLGDARAHAFERARVVLFFDVLHMVSSADQERLLAIAAQGLDHGGTIVVREPDAGAGWAFTAVRAGNTLKAAITGNWRQRFHFRPAAAWVHLFEALGFRVEQRGTGEGTPFANVLFVLRRAGPPATE
jgi:uncharacterized protein (DUF2062 family)